MVLNKYKLSTGKTNIHRCYGMMFHFTQQQVYASLPLTQTNVSCKSQGLGYENTF